MKIRASSLRLTAALLIASSEDTLAFVPSRSASCPTLTTATPCSLALLRSPGAHASGSRSPSRRGTYLNVHSANDYLSWSSLGVRAGSLQYGGDQPLLQHLSSADSASLLLSDIGSTGGGGNILSSVSSVLTAGFVIAAAIFIYANVVYTPEIIENARAMREEEQTEQILALVKQIQKERGVEGVRDSRDALEKVFGTSVERYVEAIEKRMQGNADSGEADDVSVPETEKELAELLRSIYL